MTEPNLQKFYDNFKQNVKLVEQLIKFDDIVLKFSISPLEKANEFIKSKGISNPSCDVSKSLEHLKKIRQNESLKPNYQVMLNQCVVLLVSYFTSALEEIFSTCLTLKIGKLETKIKKETIKISIDELEELNFDLKNSIGELIIRKKSISFQDMQNTARAFNDWLGYEPKKDKNVNNIILAQACRHAIVHAGGIAKEKTINQISNAKPRAIMKNLKINDKIIFHEKEIKIIFNSMSEYLENIIECIS